MKTVSPLSSTRLGAAQLALMDQKGTAAQRHHRKELTELPQKWIILALFTSELRAFEISRRDAVQGANHASRSEFALMSNSNDRRGADVRVQSV